MDEYDDGLYWVILLMYGSHDMRHTGFRRLTVVNGTLGFWDVTDLINMIRKSALLTEQFEKVVIKNKFGVDIYNNIESYFLDKYYEKVFKNQCILFEQFRTKNSGIKIGYMAYHNPDLFFVVYLAYVNMSLLDQKYLETDRERGMGQVFHSPAQKSKGARAALVSLHSRSNRSPTC